MKLSPQEKTKLVEIKSRYIAAIKQRSHHPYEFDANVACLREVEVFCKEFQSLCIPYSTQLTNLGAKLEDAKCNIFALLKAKHKISKYQGLLKEVNSIIYDKEFLDLVKQEFGEKSITSLGFNEHEATKKTYKSGFFQKVEHEHTKNYSIKFSDDTSLTWHSLEAGKEMTQAEGLFNDKMKQLTAFPQFIC